MSEIDCSHADRVARYQMILNGLRRAAKDLNDQYRAGRITWKEYQAKKVALAEARIREREHFEATTSRAL